MKLIRSSLRNLAPTIELVEQLTRSGKDEVGVILVETMPGPMGDEAEVEEEDERQEVSNFHRNRTYSYIITLTDGQIIE